MPKGLRENPRTNRRVIAASRGGPEVLEYVDEPVPVPARGEVRVKMLATGVSYADLLMREGVHPETPHGPITLGWDLVDIVDELGPEVTGVAIGETVAALPMLGGHADYLCLPPDQLVPVPAGLDPAEAVSMVLNYMTAYQMLHRSARVRSGQRVLVHGAVGGVGSALLQLGRLANLTMYGTAAQHLHDIVVELGAIPIDYQRADFVGEIERLTDDGVDVVFDDIGGTHVWRSFKTLRSRGTVVAYGLTSSLQSGRLAVGARHRWRGLPRIAGYVLMARCLPGRRTVRVYSIQRRMWRHPDWFREDLTALFHLLLDGEVRPLIAARIPLAEARKAYEMLARGSVTGKIVLMCHPYRTCAR